jgi:hypothetical protein
MTDRERELPGDVESRWREWTETEPAVDERQLKRNLLQRIPDRRSRATRRLVLVAAAATLLVALIGVDTLRRPRPGDVSPKGLVHETGPNVILVLREGAEPIYVATETRIDQTGE